MYRSRARPVRPGRKKNGAHLPAQLRTPATRDRTAAEVVLKVEGRSTRTLLSWWKESSTETLFSHPALRYRSTVVRSDFIPFGFFALVNFVAAFSSFFFGDLSNVVCCAKPILHIFGKWIVETSVMGFLSSLVVCCPCLSDDVHILLRHERSNQPPGSAVRLLAFPSVV